MTELEEVADAIWIKLRDSGQPKWKNKADCVRHVAANMPGETPAIVNSVAEIAYDKMRKVFTHSCAVCNEPITGKGQGRGWTCGSQSCMRDYYN